MIIPRRISIPWDPVLEGAIEEHRQAIVERTPRNAAGSRLAVGAEGFRFSVDRQYGGGGSTSAAAPFQGVVGMPANPDGSPGAVWKCYIRQGDLREGIGMTRQTIEGLTTDANLAATPPVIYYFPMLATDAVWLELELGTDASVSYAVIKSWGQGDAGFDPLKKFGNTNAYCQIDNSDPANVYIRFVRLLIGYAMPAADGVSPVWTQCLAHHLMLEQIVEQGFPCTYPFICDSAYPGVTPANQTVDPDTGGGGGSGGGGGI